MAWMHWVIPVSVHHDDGGGDFDGQNAGAWNSLDIPPNAANVLAYTVLCWYNEFGDQSESYAYVFGSPYEDPYSSTIGMLGLSGPGFNNITARAYSFAADAMFWAVIDAYYDD